MGVCDLLRECDGALESLSIRVAWHGDGHDADDFDPPDKVQEEWSSGDVRRVLRILRDQAHFYAAVLRGRCQTHLCRFRAASRELRIATAESLRAAGTMENLARLTCARGYLVDLASLTGYADRVDPYPPDFAFRLLEYHADRRVVHSLTQSAARVWFLRGDYEEAYYFCQIGLPMCKSGQHCQRASYQIRGGRSLLRVGKTDAARQWIEDAGISVCAVSPGLQQASLSVAMGLAWREIGDEAAAADWESLVARSSPDIRQIVDRQRTVFEATGALIA